MDALIRDIELYLADRPIVARPISPIEHVLRWTRRNPVAFGSLAAVACVVVAALFIVTTLLVRTKQQNVELENQRSRLIATVDNLFTESAKWLQTHPSTQDLRQQLLASAKIQYEQIVDTSENDKASRIALAEATFRLADLLRRLREMDAAEEVGREALSQFELLQADYPDSHRFTFDIFHCQQLLYQHELAYETISKLCKTHPIRDYLDAWASASRARATLHERAGETKKALRFVEIGLAPAKKVKDDNPGDPFYRRHYDGLSFMQCRYGSNDEALLECASESLLAIELAIKEDPTELAYLSDLRFASTAAIEATVAFQQLDAASSFADRYFEATQSYIEWDFQRAQAWTVYFDAAALKLKFNLFPSSAARKEFSEVVLRKLAFANQFWPGDSQIAKYTAMINGLCE